MANPSAPASHGRGMAVSSNPSTGVVAQSPRASLGSADSRTLRMISCCCWKDGDFSLWKMDENCDLVGENGDSAGDRKWFDEWTLWFCSAREIGDLPEHNHISCCCWLGSNRSTWYFIEDVLYAISIIYIIIRYVNGIFRILNWRYLPHIRPIVPTF